MKNNKPIVSLCMPTNGVIEWVFPALDSIYNQNVDNSLFEVVVTNNGNNDEFDKLMNNYASKHQNLIYSKNDSYMFNNQLEALKLASGLYLKFINHRNIFKDKSLKQMIDYIDSVKEEKPVIYFLNGDTGDDKPYECNCFDLFVRKVNIYISWTSGVGIWKEDYDEIKNNLIVDKISPHSCILFSKRNKDKYVVHNLKYFRDITYGHKNKGTYDLFKAFAVEEPSILLKLYIDGDISRETLDIVLKGYKKFVASLYYQFVIKKEECSYNLNGFDDSMGVFFSKRSIIRIARRIRLKQIVKKLINLFKKIIRIIISQIRRKNK